MKSVIDDFNLRAKEIDIYFQFLKDVVDKDSKLRISDGKKWRKQKFPDSVQKILKANLFLLLYNLIESSFTKSLEHICKTINDHNLIYPKTIPEIKKIWVKKQAKYFDPPNKGASLRKEDHFLEMIDSISTQVISIPSSLDDSGYAGNIDAKKIREIGMLYGLFVTKEVFPVKGKELLLVKNRRNALAHGNQSFSECGRDYSINRLEEIKIDSISYMKFILNSFKLKVNKKYFQSKRVKK